MERSVTFIHAADLHLGAPFKGLRGVSPEWADRLVASIPLALGRIIDVAIEDDVDFVVFAGDTFDGSQPSYADYVTFANGMRRLEQAGIKAYCCAGNHDPLAHAQRHYGMLPDNVTVFPDDQPGMACHVRDGETVAVVAGRSLPAGGGLAPLAGSALIEGITRDALVRFAREQRGVSAADPFTVGVLHTGLDVDQTRAPVSRQELVATGLDYWACGHIHKPMLFPETSPRIAFSGAPQGRASSELGDHGVLEVTLSAGAPNEARFIPVADVVWMRLETDVSECRSIDQIAESIQASQIAANAPLSTRNMICSVRLTGTSALAGALDERMLADLRASLNDDHPYFFIDEIRSDITPPLDRAALIKEGLFPAAFIQEMEAVRSDPALQAAALQAIQQELDRLDVRLPVEALDGQSASRTVFDRLAHDAETEVLVLLSEQEGPDVREVRHA